MIFIDITILVNNLPIIMLYMAQGYVFLTVYSFMRFKQNELNHLFFKSVIASYILKIIFDWLFIKKTVTENVVIKTIRLVNAGYESPVYCILLLAFSALLGIFLAYVTQSNKFNRLLLKLKVKRTTNQSIWDDVIEPNCWIMIYLNSTESVYFGQFKYGEEFARKPLVVLEHYKIMDLDGNVKADYSDNPSEIAIIDTKDIERMEITYK